MASWPRDRRSPGTSIPSRRSRSRPSSRSWARRPCTGTPATRSRARPATPAISVFPACSTPASCGRRPTAPTLKSLDTAGAEKIAGVRVVRDGDLVAVLHEHPGFGRRGPGRDQGRYGTLPTTGLDDTNIYDSSGQERSGAGRRRPGRRPRRRGQGGGRVRSTRPISTPTSPTPRWRPTPPWSSSKDGKATVWASTQSPFRTEGRNRPGPGNSGGERPRHHALCRRRIRRQEPQPPGRPGRPAGQSDGQARPGRLDARGRILLRHLPAGGRRQDQVGVVGGREDRLLGLRGLFAGERSSAQFYDIPHHRTVGARRMGRRRRRGGDGPSVRRRGLARAGQQHQHLRPGEPDRHHGRQGGDGSAGIPAEEPGQRAHAEAPEGGRRQVRLDADQIPERPRLRRGLRRLRGHLRGHDGRGRSGQVHRAGPGQADGLRPRLRQSRSIPRACASRSKAA